MAPGELGCGLRGCWAARLTVAGKSTNLSPFSYFNVINHDPPLFIIGFAGGFEKAKDSLRNLTESGECAFTILRLT